MFNFALISLRYCDIEILRCLISCKESVSILDTLFLIVIQIFVYKFIFDYGVGKSEHRLKRCLQIKLLGSFSEEKNASICFPSFSFLEKQFSFLDLILLSFLLFLDIVRFSHKEWAWFAFKESVSILDCLFLMSFSFSRQWKCKDMWFGWGRCSSENRLGFVEGWGGLHTLGEGRSGQERHFSEL